MIDNGLHFYALGVEHGYGASNYTPSLYALLAIPVFPSLIAAKTFGFQMCGILSDSNCLAESISLKLITVVLASLACWLFAKATASHNVSIWSLVLAVIMMPTTLYSWLLFGAYDGIGVFVAVVGSILFLDRDRLSKELMLSRALLGFVGLALAAMGVSSKLFPIVIVAGISVAIAKSRRDAAMSIIIPCLWTASQVFIISRIHGKPLSIVGDKLNQVGPFLYDKWLASAVLLIAFGFVLRITKSRYRLGLGLGLSASIFSLGFPAILWHPQWQIYYGISILFALATISASRNERHLLRFLLIVQAVCFALAVQLWANNADITMSLAIVNRALVPSAHELARLIGLDWNTIIQAAWKIYSITQLAILGLIIRNFWVHRKSRDSRDSRLVIRGRRLESIVMPSSVAFLATWIFILLFSSFFTPGLESRLSIARGNAHVIGRTLHTDPNPLLPDSSFKSLRSYADSKSNLLQLESGETVKLELNNAGSRGMVVKYGAITIGNNMGTSAGVLDVCLEEARDSDQAISPKSVDQCTRLLLEDTNDNIPTRIVFNRHWRARWVGMNVTSYLAPGSNTPVLYLDAAGRPAAVLYAQRENDPAHPNNSN